MRVAAGRRSVKIKSAIVVLARRVVGVASLGMGRGVVFTFYFAAAIALLATLLAVSRANAVHALLYLVVSLLSSAVVFFLLGAPFAAALEVIIYAGAVIVLFLFAVMLLDLGPRGVSAERHLIGRSQLWGPALLAGALLAELGYVLLARQGVPAGPSPAATLGVVEPQEVARTLLGPYLVGVEVASLLLLAGLVGAYHLSRRSGRAGAP